MSPSYVHAFFIAHHLLYIHVFFVQPQSDGGGFVALFYIDVDYLEETPILYIGNTS